MSKIYGYCRISNPKQSIQRQVENISKYETRAEIVTETFTGTTSKRPKWEGIKNKLKAGDVVIFDSVSRMSRNAEEGIQEYMELMEIGVNLVFLKEPYINTDVFQEQMKGYKAIDTSEEDLKPLFEGIQETLKRLAKRQILIAFEQAEKEVKDLQERTREGLREAKAKGIKLGHHKTTLTTKKSIEMKDKIKKINVKFGGNMNNEETIKTLKINRNTFYKYVKELEI